MISALLLSLNFAMAKPGFDRVDVVAADSGTWINYDLPLLGTAPTQSAIRWLTQVQVVFELPYDLYLGTSISSQSLIYDRTLWSKKPVGAISAYGGVQTNTLLPRGIMAGMAYRVAFFRTSIGISVLSSATWKRPDYTVWHALPTISIGFGKPD